MRETTYLTDLPIGGKIYFKKDEPNPYEVKAKSENYLIATAEDGDYKRYTIIDTEKGICGPHDRTFNPYDFAKQEDIEQCLRDMIDKKRGIDISRRHGAKVSDVLDLEKTIGIQGAQFENWVADRERELFRTEHFRSIGKGNDYVFQTLVFTGEASQRLSIATTILSNLKNVPNRYKSELKSIQQQLHDFQEKIRNI